MKQILFNKTKLVEENRNLKRALAVCLNRPLLKELSGALQRINYGEFFTKEEFFKDSPLRVAQ